MRETLSTGTNGSNKASQLELAPILELVLFKRMDVSFIRLKWKIIGIIKAKETFFFFKKQERNKQKKPLFSSSIFLPKQNVLILSVGRSVILERKR